MIEITMEIMTGLKLSEMVSVDGDIQIIMIEITMEIMTGLELSEMVSVDG
nr:hypothetical protein [Tanacetum cinerariifolium]